MDQKERIEVYKRALEKWGSISQMEMAQEEATELALAVRKQIRYNTHESFLALCSEVADVEIMVEQMEMMMENEGFRSMVDEYKFIKIQRLKHRLNINKFNAE